MKLSSDGKYKLFPDCANDAQTGETVAAWNANTHAPHANHPNSAQFLEQYSAEIPAPEPVIPAPNWSSFRVSMLNNGGYQRVTLLATADNNGRLAVTRAETTMSMDSPNLAVLEVLWEMVIAALPPLSKPTTAEVGQWKTIATANNMPFTFKSDGKIQLSPV